MDPEKFDITVQTLFDVGENRQFLKPHIKYIGGCKKDFPGNSHVMKLATPKQLHKILIKEHYDIEVAYLEGPAARVISGCQDEKTKTVCWIHCTMPSQKVVGQSFRNYKEAVHCYKNFNKMVFVSDGVKKAFLENCPVDEEKSAVLYNINESDIILGKATESVEPDVFERDCFNWCGVGKLMANKGYDRMLRIQKRLIDEGYKVHFYALGVENSMRSWSNIARIVEFLIMLLFLGINLILTSTLQSAICTFVQVMQRVFQRRPQRRLLWELLW
jgi:glycosyltransferase involved in cell wall biosynthesis